MRIRWRGFELPSRLSMDRSSATSTYGRFVAEPFEKGYGHTIGNSLRRVLLSSLEGSAIVSVRLQGVAHEFTSMPGVIEDVTEVCLNLKSVAVRNESATRKTGRIERHEKGVIRARDIVFDDSVRILNGDLVIATLTDDVPFVAEIVVENGRGYIPAYERQQEPEVGSIPLDACFSPVTRVRHSVEQTRVGQRTNYDRLILEIWTDGTTSPELALIEASKILRKHLTAFVSYRETGIEISPDGGLRGLMESTGYAPIDLELEERLGMSLAELNLSVRATNCLESEGITSVRDLVSRTEDQLLQVRNFGETTLLEVRERLTAVGLRLGMRLPSGGKTGR